MVGDLAGLVGLHFFVIGIQEEYLKKPYEAQQNHCESDEIRPQFEFDAMKIYALFAGLFSTVIIRRTQIYILLPLE